ncbi:MAG: Nif3-like dinuclear metal center hexameric protein [bacterium]
MTTVADIVAFFETWAPLDSAASWDNVGLQLGDSSQSISTVLVALEIDGDVLQLMNQRKVDMVITHHPLFFKPIKSIDYRGDLGQVLVACFSNQTAVFSAHTNLDVAKGGVNDCLIRHYGLEAQHAMPILEGFGGVLACELDFKALRSVMPCRVLGDQDVRPVQKIGFCAGSGHGLVTALPDLGVDTFVTGEVTYHDHVFCAFHGIRIITVGHYASEVLVVPEIASRLRKAMTGLDVLELARFDENAEVKVFS